MEALGRKPSLGILAGREIEPESLRKNRYAKVLEKEKGATLLRRPVKPVGQKISRRRPN